MRFAAIVGLIAFALASVDADDSLGKSLINAVVDGDVANPKELSTMARDAENRSPSGPMKAVAVS